MLGEFSIYLLDVRIRLTKSLLGAFSGAPAASFGQHIHSHLKQKRRKVGKVPQELTVATRVREIKGNGGSARRGEPQRASYPSSPTLVA